MAGHQPVERAQLPRANRVALQLIEQLIDAKLPDTCPGACLRSEAVKHANNCYWQNKQGEMVAIYGEPTIVLMEAVDLIGQGYNARQQWDWDNPPPREDK